MKKQVIHLPDFNPLKETPEQRKQRIQNSKPMGTIISKDKTKYNRKQKHKRSYDNEI